jgi:hypothetical protein
MKRGREKRKNKREAGAALRSCAAAGQRVAISLVGVFGTDSALQSGIGLDRVITRRREWKSARNIVDKCRFAQGVAQVSFGSRNQQVPPFRSTALYIAEPDW